jgi:hypothetical protein
MLPLFRRAAVWKSPREIATKLAVIPHRTHSRLYFTFHWQTGASAKTVAGGSTNGASRTPQTATLIVSQAMQSAVLSWRANTVP